MINTNELRQGNLIFFRKRNTGNDVIKKVIAIQSQFIEIQIGRTYENKFLDEVFPVPVTEDWLLNLGFIKHVLGYKKNKVLIHYSIKLKDHFFFSYSITYVNIHHIHQLQNLYFALTGEELKIKKNEEEEV